MVLPDKVKPKIVLLLFYLHANFPVTVTFIVSFLLITNLSYVRILSLLSLTVILLKMYVEAYKTSVKLNVKSKVVFFSRYAFFPYVYHRSLPAVISYQATMAKEQEYL